MHKEVEILGVVAGVHLADHGGLGAAIPDGIQQHVGRLGPALVGAHDPVDGDGRAGDVFDQRQLGGLFPLGGQSRQGQGREDQQQCKNKR